jgi:hypothetical protein
MALANYHSEHQTKARAGGGWFFAACTSALCAITAWILLTGKYDSVFEAAMYGLFGAIFGIAAVHTIRSALAGGMAQLELPHASLSFGAPHRVTFRLERKLPAQNIHTRVKMLFRRDEDANEEFWRQDFAAMALDTHTFESTIMLPTPLPLNKGADGDFIVMLSLHVDKLEWQYELSTEPVTEAHLRP